MANDTSKLIDHYSTIDLQKGPKIYSRSDMYNAVFDLGRFEDLPTDRPSAFVDLMSGVKCLVASEIKKRAEDAEIPIDIYCLDIAFRGLNEDMKKELSEKGYILQEKDITRGTEYEGSIFHRAAERFGFKNYQKDVQEEIFNEVRRIMKPGGILVITDMVSPESSYDWIQTERKRKSSHTIGEENAMHHVPTLDMWFEMLENAGFKPNKDNVYNTLSKVKTQDWVNSNQMGREGLEDMNMFLLSAPERAKMDFNIRKEDDLVRIDYPVSIFAAELE